MEAGAHSASVRSSADVAAPFFLTGPAIVSLAMLAALAWVGGSAVWWLV